MKIRLFFLSTTLLFLFLHDLTAQVEFKANVIQPDAANKARLDNDYKDYTLFEFDHVALSNFLKSNRGKTSAFQLKIGDYNWKIDLQENDLRGLGFKAIGVTDEGEVAIDVPITTYKGFSNDEPLEHLRLNIDDYSINGYVFHKNEIMRIEPFETRNGNTFVLYAAKDFKKGEAFSCGNEDFEIAPLNETPSILNHRNDPNGGCWDPTDVPPTTMTTNCRLLQLAVEGDCEFVANLGGNMAAAAGAIIGAVNIAEGFYVGAAAFNTFFQISHLRVYSSAGGCGAGDIDPYRDGAGGWTNTANNEITAIWQNDPEPADIVFLFTGVATCGGAASPVGQASIATNGGTLCLGLRANAWFSDCLGFGTIGFGMIHEMGHLFGMIAPDHDMANACIGTCTAPTPTIMCAGGCFTAGPTLAGGWSAASVATINTYLTASGGCLGQSSGEIIGPNFVCQTPTAFTVAPDDGFVPLITNVTVGPGLTFNQINPQVNFTISASNSSVYKSWVEVQYNLMNGANVCTATLRREVYTNGIPLFADDYKISCYDEFWICSTLPENVTFNNINCVGSDCNDLDFLINIDLDEVSVEGLALENGDFSFHYTYSTPCGGLYHDGFEIHVDDCSGGGDEGGDRSELEESETLVLQNGQFTGPELKVSPNPANQIVNISYQVKRKGLVSLNLYDINGTVVKQIMSRDYKETGAYSEFLDINDLPNGTYFVSLVSKNGTQVEKLVKL